MSSRRSHLPTLISTRSTVVRKIEHTIFNPAGLSPIVLLPEPRIDTSSTLLDLRNEGVLLAFGLCLASGAAGVHTADLSFIFVAEIIPTDFVAGHHLGQNILLKHVTVRQHI